MIRYNRLHNYPKSFFMKRNLSIAIMFVICIVFVSGCTTNPASNSVNLIVGQQYELTTNYKANEWISSNTSVATVENGIITALSVGVATIKAKGSNYSCIVGNRGRIQFVAQRHPHRQR